MNNTPLQTITVGYAPSKRQLFSSTLKGQKGVTAPLASSAVRVHHDVNIVMFCLGKGGGIFLDIEWSNLLLFSRVIGYGNCLLAPEHPVLAFWLTGGSASFVDCMVGVKYLFVLVFK